uniref:EGF-like domain-containing protein n=1 Tax=Meloidogyne incognita TaxID=6306 RepID=A0A914NHX7_MELIC
VNIYQHNFYLPQHFLNVFVLVDLLALFCEILPKSTKNNYENIDERQKCINKGCRNGGKCVKNLRNVGDGDLWTCLCPPGFQGSQCESEINACLNVTCKHKGKCVNLGGVDFRCDCAPGWSGHVCEINIDDCENIVCLNGGVCVDRVNNYLCECARGFAGRHCEVKEEEINIFF